MSLKFPISVYDSISEIPSRKDLDKLIDNYITKDFIVWMLADDLWPSDLLKIFENAGYDIQPVIDALEAKLEPYNDSDEETPF